MDSRIRTAVAGVEAYLVGGAVRDELLGRQVVDVDVATPDPEGPPSRNEASTTDRPALERLPPSSAKEKSRKNFPAPENWRKAP